MDKQKDPSASSSGVASTGSNEEGGVRKMRVQDYGRAFWSKAATPVLFYDREGVPENRIVRLDREEEMAKSVLPRTDLLYVENERQMYYWTGRFYAPLAMGDKTTGPLARFVTDWLTQQYEVSAKTSLIAELQASILKGCPNIFKTNQAPRFIALEDAAFDFDTFTTAPFSRDEAIFGSLPAVSTQLDQPTPVFDRFLKDAFPDEDGVREFVVEMMGYYLIPHDEEPACFFLHGAAASGKSTLIDLMRHLIGWRFYSAISMKDLTTDKFVAAGLAGKLANIYDEDQSDKVDLGKLKALISHVPLEVQRKFEQPFMMKPYAKFIFAANHLPTFNSFDKGVHRRIWLIEFMHSVPPEKADKHLLDKLKAESSGIVGKCLRAAKGFVDRGYRFNAPAVAIEWKEEFNIESNPVLQFIDEKFRISNAKEATDNAPIDSAYGSGNHWWIPCTVLYGHYKEWCQQNNRLPFSSTRFFKVLTHELPEIPSGRFGKDRIRFKGLIAKDESMKLQPLNATWSPNSKQYGS